MMAVVAVNQQKQQQQQRFLIKPTNQMPFFLPGFWFEPTRQELSLYLHRKIIGLSLLLPSPPKINDIFFFHDCEDVYGDYEPWNVFDGSSSTEGNYFYVFTSLRGMSLKSKRINRRAGTGNWVCKTKPIDINDCDGKLIGFDRYFVFKPEGGGGGGVGGGDGDDLRKKYGPWRMHEFSLPGIQSPGDLVLCVIACSAIISITNDPSSSINFDKYFYGGGDHHLQCNIPNGTTATTYTDSVAANCYQNQNFFLPMSNNFGVVESLEGVLEHHQQQPMVIQPLFSGSEDGSGSGYYFPGPSSPQMLQSNDGVHESSYDNPLLLTEEYQCFSGFGDTLPDSTALSISNEAAEEGEGGASTTHPDA